jgi:hypothetical protein
VSQEIREKALGAAVTVAGSLGDDAVVEAATKFATFLAGNASPKASAGTSTSPKTTSSAASAQAVSKPATTKVVSGSFTTGSKPAKTASVSKATPEVDPDAKKMVGDKVNEMLKANKRDEAVALLASFADATSATGIVKQGDDVISAFMEGADAILSADSGSLAD